MKQRVEQGTSFSGEELLKIMEDILTAIDYLKSFKMVHGDIRLKYIYYSLAQTPH
jgi:hypothetical protein